MRGFLFLWKVTLFFQFSLFDSVSASNKTDDWWSKAAAASSSTGGLVWQDLYVEVNDVILLEPTSGFIPKGSLCGILGPSGSGKSTFLNALSRQTDGAVYEYHTIPDRKWYKEDLRTKNIAFLQQHSDFFSMLTVRETLQLAAFLEVGHSCRQERDDLIVARAKALGLELHLDRPIGDSLFATKSRLSGGERRRLAIALELLTDDKHLLLADEPLSGLDSTRALSVLQLVQRTVQTRNIPGLVVLHQARSRMWHMLDHVLLMAPGGRVCFCGEREEALDFVKSQGFSCPSATNPAEFLVELMSIDAEDEETAQVDRERIDSLAESFAEYQRKRANAVRNKPKLVATRPHEFLLVSTSRRLGPLRLVRRFAALVRRSWRQTIRNRQVHLFRGIASLGNAVLLSQIFPSVGRRGQEPSANSVADRVALLSFGAINMCFLACVKTTTLISDEKPVVQREQSRQQYSSFEYLLAKILVEIPVDGFFTSLFTGTLKQYSGLAISWSKVTMVFGLLTTAASTLGLLFGSWLPSGKLATTTSVPVLVILMVVGIINPSGVDSNAGSPPVLIQALKRISPFAYAIEGLCLGEYPGMKFGRWDWRNLPRLGGLSMVRTGEQVLDALGLAGKSFEDSMMSLGKLSAGFLALSWLGMIIQNHNWHHRRKRSSPVDRNTMKVSPHHLRVNLVRRW